MKSDKQFIFYINQKKSLKKYTTTINTIIKMGTIFINSKEVKIELLYQILVFIKRGKT